MTALPAGTHRYRRTLRPDQRLGHGHRSAVLVGTRCGIERVGALVACLLPATWDRPVGAGRTSRMPPRCRDDWTMQQRPAAERLRRDLAVPRAIPLATHSLTTCWGKRLTSLALARGCGGDVRAYARAGSAGDGREPAPRHRCG